MMTYHDEESPETHTVIKLGGGLNDVDSTIPENDNRDDRVNISASQRQSQQECPEQDRTYNSSDYDMEAGFVSNHDPGLRRRDRDALLKHI